MQKWVMVRYTVKADRAEENASYVRHVYEQLQQEQPPGFHYATFTLEDGVNFMHVAAVDDDATNPLFQLAAFKEFTAAIQDRCTEPPVTVALQEVGSYKLG